MATASAPAPQMQSGRVRIAVRIAALVGRQTFAAFMAEFRPTRARSCSTSASGRTARSGECWLTGVSNAHVGELSLDCAPGNLSDHPQIGGSRSNSTRAFAASLLPNDIYRPIYRAIGFEFFADGESQPLDEEPHEYCPPPSGLAFAIRFSSARSQQQFDPCASARPRIPDNWENTGNFQL
jgi:hypothetical protein